MTIPKGWKGVCEVPGYTCEKYKLGTAWWWNWCASTGHDAAYVPMSSNGEDISGIVSSRPVGSYYLIYNEPDNPSQAGRPGDSDTPVKAANRYFDVYRAIKAADSTAQIGGIGLVYIAADGHCDEGPIPPRPVGKDYLVEFLKQLKSRNESTGGINARFDFYHVHAYYVGAGGFCGAANSAGTAVTFERLEKHLDWVHGSLRTGHEAELPVNVPVWITETSHLGRTEDENQEFMDILWSRLRAPGKGFDQNVERVAWFSTYVTGGFAGTSLFKDDLSTLTDLGDDWRKKEGGGMAYDFKGVAVPITGNGTRYKDYTWTHGMGRTPAGVVALVGMTGVGDFWGVNEYNPSATMIKCRVFRVDGGTWDCQLTLTILGWWT